MYNIEPTTGTTAVEIHNAEVVCYIALSPMSRKYLFEGIYLHVRHSTFFDIWCKKAVNTKLYVCCYVKCSTVSCNSATYILALSFFCVRTKIQDNESEEDACHPDGYGSDENWEYLPDKNYLR